MFQPKSTHRFRVHTRDHTAQANIREVIFFFPIAKIDTASSRRLNARERVLNLPPQTGVRLAVLRPTSELPRLGES